MEFVTDPDDQGSAMAVDDVDTPEIFGEGVIVPLTFKINAWNSTFLSCLEFDIISNCCQIFFVVIILVAMPGTKKNSDCSHIGYAFNKLMKQIGHPELKTYPKRIKRRLEDDGIFCSCTSSSPGSSVCGRDCHCGMLLSSCSSGCSCGSSCLNKPFQHRPVKKLKLIKTEKCGEGIVADEDIKHGEFVAEVLNRPFTI
ncbi:hypothetical protein V6Z11_D01G153600 [Gossypium hirsutum]|uniref:Histone-lysine N-methyltransferase ASHH3 isoform X2 n=1 Tax=Gossypium hirsutum TaxID=3635 RepID=A0ABM2ZHQ6_GOSHI|nr:histone-lysine N-methyltransferase ASHH3 isoform X2 [Gossypium hirsutum]